MSTSADHAIATSPVFRPVGDAGVLITFGEQIDDAIHAAVLAMDAAISDSAIAGVLEISPAYASLLVDYDPQQITYEQLHEALQHCVHTGRSTPPKPQTWRVPVCYDDDFAPDTNALANLLHCTAADIIAEHSAARYKVYLYGFAPGYAYLGGTPTGIQVPRKPEPVQRVPAGSVMIAGPQSLITTVEMPSGWWVIGRATATPLNAGDKQAFRFAVGDEVVFEPIDSAEFQARQGEPLKTV